jgi:RNase adapter protein RapZ
MEPSQAEPRKKIVLVTGLSGAGKTAALKTLEDLGYFTIDNLPTTLLDPLLVLFKENLEITRVALGMDCRDPGFVRWAEQEMEALRKRGHETVLIYLQASTEVLIRRFAETRRPHPLARGGRIEKGVRAERQLMAGLKRLANEVLDTTRMNIHELRKAVRTTIEGSPETLNVVVESFGFKYGVPLDASFVFDVRFLPNPYFVDGLRELDGTRKPVAEYVFAHPDTGRILDSIYQLVSVSLPLCKEEGRTSLVVAVGCTGGQHRSVALVESLAARLTKVGVTLTLLHRDLPRSIHPT